MAYDQALADALKENDRLTRERHRWNRTDDEFWCGQWATPWWVVLEAADFLGIDAFDLDPCATDENHKAPVWFTRAKNGLEQPWFGNVFLNSPFSRSLAACRPVCGRKACVKRGSHLEEPQHGAVDFAKKAVAELKLGRVDAIAWHGPVAPDTDWYAMLWPWVHLRVDYNGRIPYNDADAGGTFPSQTMILKPTMLPTQEVPTLLRPVQPRRIEEAKP